MDQNIGEFDIVIPVGMNDIDILKKQLEYTKKNIVGYRNIYIVGPSIIQTLDIDESCIIIDEKIFPFSKQTVANFHGDIQRNFWYLQQLIKLYCGFCIPNILERYLVIDADTFFLKPTKFIENDKCLYNFGIEYYQGYFDHMKRLDPNLEKVDANKSGICHHMIFETKFIKEIFEMVESRHNDIFYNIFLKCVPEKEYISCGASEYEIYFNYMLKYHSDKIHIRKLNWRNLNEVSSDQNYDYVSLHWYMR
jgi:hypothetical protein